MSVKGQYVDRRLATVSPHAAVRYTERFDPNEKDATAVLLWAWKYSRQVLPMPWWKDRRVSYWAYEPWDLLLVVKNKKGQLSIATCITLEMARSMGNPRVAKAVRKLLDDRAEGATA